MKALYVLATVWPLILIAFLVGRAL